MPAAEFAGPGYGPAGLDIRRYRNWEELDPDVREMIASEPHDFGWDVPKRLAEGWELWAGFMEGRLAALCWTRHRRQAREFWAQLGPHDLLIGPAATAPVFRGRGIFTAMLASIAREAPADRVVQLWVACLQSNVASRRAIERVGFAPVGRAIRTVLGGRQWLADGQEPHQAPAQVGQPAHA
jgi:RimJ/RimL family protein N-acetyltransferase